MNIYDYALNKILDKIIEYARNYSFAFTYLMATESLLTCALQLLLYNFNLQKGTWNKNYKKKNNNKQGEWKVGNE